MEDKKKKKLAIRSSAAEYLTFVASTGESDASFEMRYEDENIWLTQKMMAALCICCSDKSALEKDF